MQLILRLFNFRGELFSSTFTYGLTAFIKLGSSLILTRLLSPEAYGVMAILYSVAFIVELVSDVGTIALLVRHPRGSEARFVHTLWTVRLIRSVINFCALYASAGLIANLYDMPVLADALRVFSFYFLLHGLESMAFVLAQRDQRSRITNYAELATSTVMTVAVIALAVVLKDHYAFIYGTLLQRLLMVIVSHCYYRRIGIAFAFDREAVKEQFKFARVVMPSSMLTIVLSQYDKLILLKLFDLTVLGIYGLANNVIGPLWGLIYKNSRVVLYARCADYFRTDRATAASRYYAENKRLMAIGTLLPAAAAGLSQALITMLYDSRYAGAGPIMMAMGIGAVIVSFQEPAENLLVAYGKTSIVLLVNLLRVFTAIPASLLGYYWFGLQGFLWFGVGSAACVLLFVFSRQRRYGLLDWRIELRRFAWAAAVFALCLAASMALMTVLPDGWLRHAFR